MQKLDKVIGICNIVILFCIFIFLIQTYLRKLHLTKFVWICLLQLMLCTAAIGTLQIVFANNDTRKHCGLIMQEFYVTEVVILFNLSMQIGYKTAVASYEINEFASKGMLPSERTKKITNCVMIIISCFTLTVTIVSLVINLAWRNNQTKLPTFNYAMSWV